MLSSMRTKNYNCEQEAKFVQDRISSVERNLSEFCYVFSAYSRKAARVRDKGDEISRTASTYAESEDINKSLSNGLVNFANSMSVISDYGDARVQNIDNKVVKEFSQYENICKHVKEEVKQIFSVRSKEIIRRRQFDRARERNPRNRQQIIQAETELVRASSEVAKTIHCLEEQVTRFEKQKIHDVKNILLDFISSEMGYHAKCLELLTKAFQDVNCINEDSDLEDFQNVREKLEMEFKKSLRMPDTIPHVGAKLSLFRTSQSLGSLSTIFSTPKKKATGISKQITKDSKRTSKSEEILDAAKTEYTESEVSVAGSDDNDDDEDDVDSSEESKSENRVSPFIAKKYLK